MGIFSNLRASIEARLNSAAEEFEDPKASLNYSLVKLQESRAQINRSLVQLVAALERLETQNYQCQQDIDKYQRQAEQSMQAGREDLARLALERRQVAQERQLRLQASCDQLRQQAERLKQGQADLERRIALFKAKKEELSAMYDSSRVQLHLQESMSGIAQDVHQAGETLQRVEARIQQMQSRSRAIEGLVADGTLSDPLGVEGDAIDRQLTVLSRQQAIEAELEKLRLPNPDEPQNNALPSGEQTYSSNEQAAANQDATQSLPPGDDTQADSQ